MDQTKFRAELDGKRISAYLQEKEKEECEKLLRELVPADIGPVSEHALRAAVEAAFQMGFRSGVKNMLTQIQEVVDENMRERGKAN